MPPILFGELQKIYWGETSMKKKMMRVALLFCIIIGIGGCRGKLEETQGLPEMNEPTSSVEEIAEMKNISHIESDDCFICGQKENSLIPYYAKRDSIGIIHWNSQSVSDTRVREYDDDTIDFEKASDVLCQKCLDQVTEFYCEQDEHGDESHIGTTGFSLIDFKTRELYTLSDPYRGYMIRDYYIQFDIRENGHDRYIDLTIFYAPVREGK